MKQNVKIAGAAYSGVPSVIIPTTTGGIARYIEISDTSATVADVKAGKTFYQADGTFATGTGTAADYESFDEKEF